MKTFMTPIIDTRDVATAFGYPATAVVIGGSQNEDGQVHEIVYAGAPAALFANAPNQSKLWDTTNKRLYVKWGDIGKIDGSWEYGEVTT